MRLECGRINGEERVVEMDVVEEGKKGCFGLEMKGTFVIPKRAQ